MAEWTISHLDATHDRTSFACGKAQLDSFLHSQASQYEKRRLARTYVATAPGSAKVAGFYTLCTGALDATILPEALRKKLPKHQIPTLHLARLAVDINYHGQGLGETLLLHALVAALEISESLGVFAVDVWAIDDEARAFYKKYSFAELDDDPHHLLLPIKTVQAATGP
jgi:ribosomal protein S18 acetylase RimI-like enzyme